MSTCEVKTCVQHDPSIEDDPQAMWAVLQHCPSVCRHLGGDAKKAKRVIDGLKKAGLWEAVRSSEKLKEQRRLYKVAKQLEWDRRHKEKRAARRDKYSIATLVRKGLARPPRQPRLQLDETAILVFDTETTGLGADDLPIQIGYVLKVGGKTVLERSRVVNYPRQRGVRISDRAQEVHGITHAELMASSYDAETEVAKLARLMREVNAAGGTVVAHNAAFDLRMLRQALPSAPTWNRLNVVCTMQLARRETGRNKCLKLDQLYQEMVPQGQALAAHDALNDAKMCLALFEHFKSSDQELASTSKGVPVIMSD